jgi:hypothetical protein
MHGRSRTAINSREHSSIRSVLHSAGLLINKGVGVLRAGLAILGLEFVQARAVAIIVSIAFLVLAALLRWSARFAEASAPIRVGS